MLSSFEGSGGPQEPAEILRTLTRATRYLFHGDGALWGAHNPYNEAEPNIRQQFA